MSMIPTNHRTAGPDQRLAESGVEHGFRHSVHGTQRSHFWHHFRVMVAVMVVGMVASAAIFLTVVQMNWDDATRRHPMASLLVIAVGMSLPMAAWMLRRGMGWRNSGEMAAAMVLPVVPFLCLVWFNVTTSAQCGPYCVVSIAAMLGLMLYRRGEYSMEMAHQ